MKEESNELYNIAVSLAKTYAERKEALQCITDKNVLKELSEQARDEWIKLEAACMCENNEVLKVFTHHTDTRLRLEAAVELKDEATLADIAITSKEPMYVDIALNHICSDIWLTRIAKKCKLESMRVEAAIRTRNGDLLQNMLPTISDESLVLRIAIVLNDMDVLESLSVSAVEEHVRHDAAEWIADQEDDGEVSFD